ncbi:MAG TPA: lipid-A-disaccharide synthase, partial [Alphaproteobacteria bacterium]|nr:lipid-A-disaccharide synthase [Alphaproteobacteria bacterium]
MEENPLLFLVAGEPSGDQLGAGLMAALRDISGSHIRFVGIGGEQMAAQGLKSLFPMAELSVMGLVEVLPRVPRLFRRIRQTVHMIRCLQPAAIVTIDSPGFTFRLVRRLGNIDVPRIHYVAPTVWAWKPGRAKIMAHLFDHLMVL